MTARWAVAENEPVRATVEYHLRPVGFRSGTDAELRALHAIEAPIEAERQPDRVPRTVESYIAFARNLPSMFDDHTWLVAISDGTPVASGACWSTNAGDQRVMECDLFVRRDHRQRGIGSRLLATICDTTIGEGRSLLRWSTFDAVPAGDAFSHRLGARIARVNRTSELVLSHADWQMINDWACAQRARGLGYQLEMVDGVFPEHLRADAVTLHHIMQTAPRDNLDVGDLMISSEDVAELDRALVESGATRWTALMREPAGTCVGGTAVTFEPQDPATVLQQNTGVDPGHRGLGLAKWAKAAMLERVRHDRPQAERVRTDNAFSNAPMLAINDALGFEVISTITEWQADVTDVRRAVSL
jgi:GNAT superfamily N-acetyltransferase